MCTQCDFSNSFSGLRRQRSTGPLFKQRDFVSANLESEVDILKSKFGMCSVDAANITVAVKVEDPGTPSSHVLASSKCFHSDARGGAITLCCSGHIVPRHT